MNISRRNFIKAGAAGTTALGISGSLFSKKQWFQTAEAAKDQSTEKMAYTYHTTNCGGRCAFECTVREGKLVKIVPNNLYSKIKFSLILFVFNLWLQILWPA